MPIIFPIFLSPYFKSQIWPIKIKNNIEPMTEYEIEAELAEFLTDELNLCRNDNNLIF